MPTSEPENRRAHLIYGWLGSSTMDRKPWVFESSMDQIARGVIERDAMTVANAISRLLEGRAVLDGERVDGFLIEQTTIPVMSGPPYQRGEFQVAAIPDKTILTLTHGKGARFEVVVKP